MKCKKYLTPVFDFILTEDNPVKLLETGGGLCGSAFPAYDYSHPETIRHLMMKALSKKVKKLFLVNVGDNVLYKAFGQEFLKELGNVTFFESFATFVRYAKLNQDEWPHSSVVFDRVSPKVQFRENNYASMLEALDIQIPVVNAGAMSFFQNKVTFPLLFTDKLSSYIPKTYVAMPQTYSDLLKIIPDQKLKKFVILPAEGAHSKGTLMSINNNYH